MFDWPARTKTFTLAAPVRASADPTRNAAATMIPMRISIPSTTDDIAAGRQKSRQLFSLLRHRGLAWGDEPPTRHRGRDRHRLAREAPPGDRPGHPRRGPRPRLALRARPVPREDRRRRRRDRPGDPDAGRARAPRPPPRGERLGQLA